MIRNFKTQVDISSYNLQEIGLCKALVKKGFDCDIIYYTEQKKEEKVEIFRSNDAALCIIWMPAITVFNNTIYNKAFKNNFLNQYNYIISSEYNQTMSYLLTRRKTGHNKLILYHGPYKNESKIILRKLYDLLFLKRMINQIDFVFTKSILARNFLLSKGFKNVHVLGVGIDTDKFMVEMIEEAQVPRLDELKEKRLLLYVGRLEERRNIRFLFETFKDLRLRDPSLYLLLIGNGEQKLVANYFSYAKELGIDEYILHIRKVDQKHLKYYFEQSEVFLLPTTYEIFGMVLLECLYFGLPIITTRNGGSDLLIQNNINGVIVEEFNVNLWASAIENILADKELQEKISANGKKTIEQHCSWETIADNLLEVIEEDSKI